MGLSKRIYIKGIPYNLYDTYDEWIDAFNVAKYYKKKNRSKFFIVKFEDGYWFPTIRYALYLTKVSRIF